MSPIYGNTTYQIKLNGMSYKSIDQPLVIDDVYYISLSDLANLTYGSYHKDGDYYRLTILDDTLLLRAPNRSFLHNSKQVILNTPIREINNQTYVPLELLDAIEYPYILDDKDNLLIVDAKAPYSRTTDPYKDHILFKHASMAFNPLLNALVSEEEGNTIIKKAKQNKNYISFILNPSENDFWELIHDEAKELPPIQVTVRKFDFLSNTPHNSDFSTIPIKVRVQDDEDLFTLTLGDQKISTNCLQTAFYPYGLDQTVDVSKTIDATIMRLIYEYYRDFYDLKDDIYYSPVSFVHIGRCDSMIYPVYSDQLIDEAYTYELAIYKQINTDGINYIVDIIREL